MRIILNIIIITITLLLINYNIIVTAITNFGNTVQNMLAMQRNSAKVSSIGNGHPCSYCFLFLPHFVRREIKKQ